MFTPVNSVIVNAISSTCNFEGKFQSIWKEFPMLNEASIDKLLKMSRHSVKHDIQLNEGTRPTSAKVRKLFGEKLHAARTEIEKLLWQTDAGQIDPEEIKCKQEGLQLRLGELQGREREILADGWSI